MPKTNCNPPVILLVDDDRDCRLLVREIIAEAAPRADVREVADGETALQFLRRGGAYADAPRPQLVYLDVEMPGRDGLDVLRQVKADPALCDLPVVMLTGLDTPAMRDAALAAGAAAYFIKPVDAGRLVQAIREYSSVLSAEGPADRVGTLPGSPAMPPPPGGTSDERTASGSPCGSAAQEPFRIDAADAAAPQPGPVESGGSHGSPGLRILVIEDDLDQRELIREVLLARYAGKAGGRVHAVRTAAEGLAAPPAEFDLVLLDYNLPDADGVTVLRRILAGADVPVVFVTGENDAALAAEAIRCGAQDYVVKLGEYLLALPVIIEKSIRQHRIRRDNLRLQRQLQEMLGQLRHKNDQLQDALAETAKLAATDHLTGLYNRRHFNVALQRQFAQAVRYNHDLACALLDLDDYKLLNDTLGHQAGDEVLVAAAEAIRRTLREADVAARYGGDEFVLLLPHTSAEEAAAVVERLAAEYAACAAKVCRGLPPPSMSIGVSSLKMGEPSCADALVSQADHSLYAAKENGKNRVSIFGSASQLRATNRG